MDVDKLIQSKDEVTVLEETVLPRLFQQFQPDREFLRGGRPHEASAHGEAVRMTPKELRLLKYFVENPDRVISRNELLSEVWEMSGNLQTRAVDQLVARLRKIIEPDSGDPVHLRTVRDAGYRFIAQPKVSPTPAEDVE